MLASGKCPPSVHTVPDSVPSAASQTKKEASYGLQITLGSGQGVCRLSGWGIQPLSNFPRLLCHHPSLPSKDKCAISSSANTPLALLPNSCHLDFVSGEALFQKAAAQLPGTWEHPEGAMVSR